MRLTILISMFCGIMLPQAALALRCLVPTFDDVAAQPNTTEQMMVMGQIDAGGVFDGVILGEYAPDQPLSFQITNAFWPAADAFAQNMGWIPIANDTFFVAPLRSHQGQFHLIGNSCLRLFMGQPDAPLLIEGPTEAMIARIRQCKRLRICPD